MDGDDEDELARLRQQRKARLGAEAGTTRVSSLPRSLHNVSPLSSVLRFTSYRSVVR